MGNVTSLEQAKREHEIAYFKAELALMSPESYSLQEKQEIIMDTLLTDLMVDKTIKDDFWQLPEETLCLCKNWMV